MNLFPLRYARFTVGRAPRDLRWLRVSSIVLLLIFASGCASTGAAPVGVVGAQVAADENTVADQSASAVAPDPDENLPRLALGTQLLEQLLTIQFSLTVGDWQLGADNAMAAAQTSQDYRVARIAALLALRSQDYTLGLDAAQLWAELLPEDNNAAITLIAALLGTEMVDEAYLKLRAQQADSTLDEHIMQTAALLVRQKNADSAIGVLQRYLTDFPDSAQVALSAASVARTFGRAQLHETWLEQALVLQPEWDLAAQMKASLLQEQGKEAERAAYIEQFITEHPESVAMRINHAAELARQEAYPEALVLMQAVIADDPENVSALSYTAALAEYIEQDQLAEELLGRVLRLQPANDDARWSLARFSLRKKNYQQAERWYQQIAGEEYYFRAQLQVANMRYQTRGLQSAINVLRALKPQTEQEYVDRASTRHYLLMQERQYEEAFGAVNETLAYLPDNAELRYARALVAAEISEIATAEADLRFILELEPDHADALNALGYTLADQTDRFEEARDLISRALELAPEAAHILDSMGWVLYRLKEYEQAVDYLQQAWQAAPQAEIAAHLGEVLWEKGEAEQARDIWQQAVVQEADNPVLIETMERYGVTVESLQSEDISLNSGAR